MNWVSTRGSSPPVPFIDALFAGTAPDGGLYMPERFDPLPPGSVASLRQADMVEIDAALTRAAGGLAETRRLRGYDAVHLAAAVRVRDDDLVVVAGDTALLEAARAEGIATAKVA